MKFSEMNKRQLKEARKDLEGRLHGSLRPTRVTFMPDDYGVKLEGGTFPALYVHFTRTLRIWGRASRKAGGSMTPLQLVSVESAISQFFDDYLSEEDVEDEAGGADSEV